MEVPSSASLTHAMPAIIGRCGFLTSARASCAATCGVDKIVTERAKVPTPGLFAYNLTDRCCGVAQVHVLGPTKSWLGEAIHAQESARNIRRALTNFARMGNFVTRALVISSLTSPQIGSLEGPRSSSIMVPTQRSCMDRLAALCRPHR